MAAVNLLSGCAFALIAVHAPSSPNCPTPSPEKHQSILLSTPPTRGGPWHGLIAEAARRYALPEAWIRAVMLAESGGRATWKGRPITSAKGAMGLMQIMPDTYRVLSQRYGFGPDAYDPRNNILAGAAYLHELYQRFGYPNLFAAYNAGPGRFESYLFNGEPLPQETRTYINRIVPGVFPQTSRRLVSSRLRPSRPAAQALFFLKSTPSSLFVMRASDRR